MSQIKKNFIYNVLLTLSSYIINIFIFPYVSRTLGVELVGKIGFVNNVVSYFSLFAIMGIATVGIREIAACGDDRQRRSKVFSDIFSIGLLMTTVMVGLYVLAICLVPRFREDHSLFIVGISNLFFTSLLIEWFYQGIENFKYIAVRSVIIKIIYALIILIVIKSPSDYLLYFILTSLVIIINAFINLSYSRNYVDLSFKNVNFKKYLKPIFSLGIYRVMVSMYTTFNVIYLGFVCSDIEVGYYYTSTKLFYILLNVFTAFTSVMMPRMSSLLAEKKFEEFRQKTTSSFDLVFAISFPLIIFCVVYAPHIIMLLSGKGFEGAITPMRIIMPVLLLTGMAQIWVIQVLVPLKKDNILFIGSLVGAIMGISANILLVKSYGAIGSAVVLLVSELFGNMVTFIYAINKKYISFPLKKLVSNLLGSVPYLLVCILTLRIIEDFYFQIIVGMLLCAMYFIILNVWIIKGTIINHYIVEKVKSQKK